MKMASRLIDLIGKKQIGCAANFFFQLTKNKFARVARGFCLSLAVVLHAFKLFCTTKTSNFLVTHYF